MHDRQRFPAPAWLDKDPSEWPSSAQTAYHLLYIGAKRLQAEHEVEAAARGVSVGA